MRGLWFYYRLWAESGLVWSEPKLIAQLPDYHSIKIRSSESELREAKVVKKGRQEQIAL